MISKSFQQSCAEFHITHNSYSECKLDFSKVFQEIMTK